MTENKEYCEAIADIVGGICTANELFNAGGGEVLCTQISIIAAAMTGTGGALVLAGCEGILLMSDWTCGLTNGGDLLDELCDADFMDRQFEDLTVIAYALGMPTNIYTSPQVVNGGQLS